MPWDQLVASVEEAKLLARPVDYDYLDLVEKKFYTLRKYTPTLLISLEFRSTKSAEPLMKAVDIIRDMNETGKRKVPEGAPLNFVSNRWQKRVYDDDGTINRHYCEMAVLTEPRNYVRSGDVSEFHSFRMTNFLIDFGRIGEDTRINGLIGLDILIPGKFFIPFSMTDS